MSFAAANVRAVSIRGGDASVSGLDAQRLGPRPRAAARFNGRRMAFRGVSATLSMDPPSQAASSGSQQKKPPLIRGGKEVEEEALASALRTAQDKDVMSGRRIQYAGLDEVLQAAYRRCGEVTEDYGRTFYLGASGPRNPLARRSPRSLANHTLFSSPLVSRAFAPPCSYTADERAEAQGYLGNIRCSPAILPRSYRDGSDHTNLLRLQSGADGRTS